MNTKTAPEANTGRIVSKFWPSSLFIFVNSSWWFFPLLWSPHHVREYEKSKLTFYWNNTWRIHDNKETCLSPSLSAACGNQRWRTEWLRHQRYMYVTVLFNAPPQCSKGFLVYGFGGNFSLGIQWVVPSGQDGPILPVWVSQCRIWLILPAQVAIIIIMNIIADCCYYLPWNLQLG